MGTTIHHDRRVLACVDQSRFADFVADYAAWAAQRLSLPLEFLSVLDRHPEQARGDDPSGTNGIDAQGALLERLVEAESARSVDARETARAFLATLRARAIAAGAAEVGVRLRHGELAATLAEQEANAELIVLGRRGESAEHTGRDLGRNLERDVRALRRPIRAVTETYREPTRALVAFDGGAVTRRGVELLATSPLFDDMVIDVVMSGAASRTAPAQLETARTRLAAAGRTVEAALLPGDPEQEIARAIRDRGAELLVMGAYGHSPLRRLLRGSRTADLLRAATIPTLLLR